MRRWFRRMKQIATGIFLGLLMIQVGILLRWTTKETTLFLLSSNQMSHLQPSQSSQQQPQQQRPKRPKRNRRLLVIASVPKDERHLIALWSQLECFTSTMDTVVIAAPSERRQIVTRLVELAQQSIPHLHPTTGTTKLRAMPTFVNDRYDVGLCT